MTPPPGDGRPAAPGPPPGGANRPALLATLLSAPHRLLFAAAALLWLLVAGDWAVVLVLHATGRAWPWVIAPAQAHALPMTLGFLPLFFAGFLFTAMPRWLQVAGPDAPSLLLATGCVVAGWLLVLPALHLARGAVVLALLPVAGGSSWLVGRLLGLCRRGVHGTRRHALLATAGCALCTAALWAAIAALAAGSSDALAAVLALALWAGVGGVFVTASHRLSPWFAPRLLAPLLLGLLAQGGHAAALALGLQPARPWQMLLAAALAALALRLAWACRSGALPHGQRTRMLRLLRAPAGWLAVALGLSAAALATRGLPGASAMLWASALTVAAAHALALGFFGGTLLAMASRVAAVHSGHNLTSDQRVWALHLALQALVLLRLAAALLAPAADAGRLAGTLATGLALLATAWALLAGAWGWHVGRWLLTPMPAPRRPVSTAQTDA